MMKIQYLHHPGIVESVRRGQHPYNGNSNQKKTIILWIIFLCLGLFGSCWLIGQVWVKYRTSPTIISVQDTHYPIWNVPFPAVTVCNVNKAMHSAAIDLYKTTGLKADVGLETYLEFLKRLSDMVQPQDSDDFDLSGMEVLREKYNITMGRMMKQLAQPCETLLVACRWRGERKKCSTLFTQELSDAGYCCSFNYHALEPTNTSQTVWHVNGAGYLTGLSLLLDPELDEYFSWPFSVRGLQVLVHAPYNYPDVTARGVIIGSDREAFMQISAESTYTSDNLRHLSPHDRKCFLKEENSPNKSLGGTQYSYRNCMVQCRLQHMIKLCQCAPFNYNFFKSSKTCGLADIECLSRYKGILNNVNVEDEEVPGLNNSQGISCECLPSCEDVAYRTDLSLDRFFRTENTSNFFPGLKIKNRTILHVYFKDLSSIRFRRDIIFTWNDLLASFGGIVGLFLGCSLLSLVELVYFFTLRFILRRPLTRPRNVGVSQDQLAQTGPFAWTA